MSKGEVFFIPVDPERFFEANPFEPEHGPPDSGSGLRFGTGCLSCGDQTNHTATLIGGVRLLGRKTAWEQVVPLCKPCLALRSKGSRIKRSVWFATTAFAASISGAFVSGFASTGHWSAPGLLGSWVVLGVIAFALLMWGVGGRLSRWMMASLEIDGRPLDTYQAVDLVLFNEPRKGEDTSIICFTISNEAQARRFAGLNRHAIPRGRWNESYHGSPEHSKRA